MMKEKVFIEKQSLGTSIVYTITKKIFKMRSKYQKISILLSKDNGRLLIIDDVIMLSEKFEHIYHEMIVHVPLFSHSRPKKILIIGGGDGGCARECLKHPSVSNIDICEIDESVINASKKYLPALGKYLNNPRVRIHIENGLQFIRRSDNNYDVIIIDSTDPVGLAAGLFTKDFYSSCYKRLNSKGILCTIGSTPFYEIERLRNIEQAVRASFNYVKHFLSYNPMYQSGCWSFLIASNDELVYKKERYHMLRDKLGCKYYCEEIHLSSFSLPLDIRKQLKSKS